MVTLDNLIVFSLLNHLDLVDTTLAISSGSGGGNSGEAHVNVTGSLSAVTGGSDVLGWDKTAGGGRSNGGSVVVTVMVLLGIEGEGVQKRSFISRCLEFKFHYLKLYFHNFYWLNCTVSLRTIYLLLK